MTAYELGPNGLQTAEIAIRSWVDVEQLSHCDQELFYETRRAINQIDDDTIVIPEIIEKGRKFLTRDENYKVYIIKLNRVLKFKKLNSIFSDFENQLPGYILKSFLDY